MCHKTVEGLWNRLTATARRICNIRSGRSCRAPPIRPLGGFRFPAASALRRRAEWPVERHLRSRWSVDRRGHHGCAPVLRMSIRAQARDVAARPQV